MVSQPILDEIVSSMERMPELPAVALQVNRLMDNPQTGAQDLAKVIMLDPTMTTKVLRLCNSAQYGFSRKIATISEAVSMLGYRELKQIIFAIMSHGFLNRPVQGYALEKGALWENAVTCGTYAKHISKKVRYPDSELAFIAALLRDIGKVAMNNFMTGKGPEIEAIARSEKCSFEEAEERVVGASHTDVGARLASQWHLPDSLVSAIGYHHRPSTLPADTAHDIKTLVSIVHLADSYTMMTGTGVGVDGLMYPLDSWIFDVLPLKVDQGELEVLFSELLSLQDEIKSVVSSFKGGEA